MGVNKLVGGGLVAILAGLWLWMLGTTKNPIRDMREQAWTAAQDVRRPAGQAKLAQGSDPLVLFASSLAEVPPSAAPTHRGIVYVPAYSSIRLGSGRAGVNLATTLSIHNSSRESPIILESVSYHNTEGELVQTYLERPVALRPLGTIEMFVPVDDLRGGTGANFVVEWASASPVTEPVIEAVMIGTIGTTSYSFVSQGRSLRPVATN
jgi:hypothetical protein